MAVRIHYSKLPSVAVSFWTNPTLIRRPKGLGNPVATRWSGNSADIALGRVFGG
jgi:hypothetical protein